MTKQLMECVPNFSEGRDGKVIEQIALSIASVKGVQLLEIDPGRAANRTVITFIGAPDLVYEAAFRAIKKASELIDMSKQKGEHPRIGATDVCPFIPYENMDMDEAVKWARKLGERLEKELGIPGYYYEYAASREERKNLANCRAGEYEGLKEKMSLPEWQTDFGPKSFTDIAARTGATLISARNILVAYNVNINKGNIADAKAIAAEIRESGKVVHDPDGNKVRVKGRLKEVKAIGWFIEEYNRPQVSVNIIDYRISAVHCVYEEIKKVAQEMGVEIGGSELIGLIPLKCLTDAGKYYSGNRQLNESETIQLAVKRMGLDELKPFDIQKKVIEYLIRIK